MDKITCVDRPFEFNGRRLSVVMINEEPHWFVTEVERVLGYEAKSLMPLIRREWADELIEGADYILVKGELLKAVKELVVAATTSSKHTRSITLLTEQGLTLVTLLSRKPAGRAMRRWISSEVMPSIRKTGRYELDKHAIEMIKFSKMQALEFLLMASEADIVGKKYLERFVLQGAAAIEGREVEGPRLLDISTYLESKGFSSAELRSNASQFGKYLKAAYVEKHGQVPEKAVRFINGSERPVFCYTEDDLDLFEAVYDEMFGV